MILKKMFRLNPNGNVEDYIKVLTTRRWYFIGMLLLGLGVIGLSFFVEKETSTQSFCSGMGAGIATISIVFILQNEWIKRNKNILKKNRLKEMDERNQQVSLQAMAASARVFILIMVCLIIYFGFVNPTITMYLASGVSGIAVLYAGFYHYYNKKM